ncbi:hydroxymethylglutaryl-CoA lyase [Ancylobacter mangrovi]|uniref:hydroxymethylglutaryl-CoA lyase n=1 Tax=Ancylobacter mangrovi TaxID=2972472 RepID=UPI002161E1C8|nr:hydroxymethylglutaryl-CoA lyase [Ancylobacter mangrovi]MCS0503713.1 hydroxymethylglutaryl-CoA lyase [Ancylobacter mangrovi]
MADSVRIVEVGPRDGLQNEAAHLAVQDRVAFIEKLLDAGLATVEAGSFVSPRWVPQMQGTDEVLRRLAGVGARLPVLVPNLTGLEAAIAAGAREVAVFVAASEAFSLRNLNCSINDSLERYASVIERALEAGLAVRGYISCVLGCPYEGRVPSAAVVRLAARLHRQGCYEISLGDTIGVGTPMQARTLVREVAGEVPVGALAVHFHDTYGQALANIYGALQEGVSVVDASAGGLGGCPYARGASGNVATEAVVYMLDGMGVRTGVALPKLIEAVRFVHARLGREPASAVYRAMTARADATPTSGG